MDRIPAGVCVCGCVCVHACACTWVVCFCLLKRVLSWFVCMSFRRTCVSALLPAHVCWYFSLVRVRTATHSWCFCLSTHPSHSSPLRGLQAPT